MYLNRKYMYEKLVCSKYVEIVSHNEKLSIYKHQITSLYVTKYMNILNLNCNKL